MGAAERARRALAGDPGPLARELATAQAAGDDDKALRALARHVVWYSAPVALPEGPPLLGTVGAPDLPLPLVTLRDGRRCLLVFSSRAALVVHEGGTGTGHVQTPAGQLFGLLTPGLGVLLDASGPVSLVLDPPAVRTVADLFRGRAVPCAFEPGPATGVHLAPLLPDDAALGAALAGAGRTAGATGLWAARALLDEPDARSCVVVAAESDGDLSSLGRALAAAAETATDLPVRVRPVRPGADDAELAGLRRTPSLLA